MNKPPVYAEQAGTFAVDYRNYDGLINLGQGDWLFTTKWSTAGNGSIYALRDGGSQVAVAQNISSIEQVTDDVFNEANFTSRVRHPRTGEVVLWLNPKGFAAAVEVKKVTVTAESKSGTVLEGRYRILVDGTRNFSSSSSSDAEALKQLINESLGTFDTLVDLNLNANDETEIGIGHNRPPTDFILKKDDFLPVAAELKDLSDSPISEGALKKINEIVATALRRISAVIARRFQLVEEGFFRQIGATSTLALVGWLTLTGKLEKIEQTVKALGASLFGW